MKMRSIFVALCAALAATACDRASYIAQAIRSDTTTETVKVDGLPMTLVRLEADEAEAPIVYYLGGSGCTSLSVYMAPYFSGADGALSVVGLEKAGVSRGDVGRSCSAEFWDGYTYDEMVARNLAAIRFLQAQNNGRPISLVGTSEGGALALELAGQVDGLDKLVIIGAGGLPQREELRLLFERRGQGAAFVRLEAQIAADPDSTTAFALGQPHAYWTSVLDRDPLESGAITAQTLIVIGAEDQNVPVASAEFAAAQIDGARLIKWPDADHVFDTPRGAERDRVMAEVVRFLLD